ncbi:hypothetical protein GCM10027280_10580 [Micromonospora polyrhachis]|uniref:SurA N-terminal domain-containing protein n=1 Tax=Micromonospora polyrhachis TaxID=1282883 RepID=A0A7W7WNP5_9ACTN|nr:hypothetical protein [Micromonospora polyrhachis]MBB4958085.1 hypothetical protein [Micromonospora polyrhachis]
MQRARRLVAVVTVAALGVIGLGACARSAPTVAAYVGDTTYSMDRVDAIYTDADQRFQETEREQFAQRGETPPARVESPISRQNVVDLLVSLELGKQVVAEKNIRVTDEVDAVNAAGVLRLSPTTEYVQLWAEWVDIYIGLREQLPSVELTDDRVTLAYQALVDDGVLKPNVPIAQVRNALGNQISGASAVSAALAQRAEQVGTTVNPRFRPVGAPVYIDLPNVGSRTYALPYVDSAAPVSDVTGPAAQ